MLRRRRRTDELLEQFRLHDRCNAYPQQLSGGLAQRLQIARAIAHHPRVLFLDEPSAGLDPQSRIAMWDAVRALRSEDITVVLTTHYMEEADELCDRVAIIDHGRILVEDTPAALKASVGGDKLYDLHLAQLAGRESLAQQLSRARRCDRGRADGGWSARARANAGGSVAAGDYGGERLWSARCGDGRADARDGVHPADRARSSRVEREP